MIQIILKIRLLNLTEISELIIVKNKVNYQFINILLIIYSIVKEIMSTNTPIFTIAKNLNVESNRILLACKKLGINAKGATKRLNKEELEKIKIYFETGKNVSDEIVNINKNKVKAKSISRKTEENIKIRYFANRLIRKS